MIIRKDDRNVKLREAMRGGPGTVIITDICTKEDLYEKGRMYANITLNPGCGVGYHVHENEEEIFVINRGRAVYSDDGTEYEVFPGDVMICGDGHGHAITNHEEEVCELTALIMLK